MDFWIARCSTPYVPWAVPHLDQLSLLMGGTVRYNFPHQNYREFSELQNVFFCFLSKNRSYAVCVYVTIPHRFKSF